MKEILLKHIKTICGDTRQTIVSVVVTSLIVGYGGLLYLSKTVLELSLLILNMQMPLWATISLTVLCCLYTYVNAAKIQSKPNPMDQSSNTPAYETKYFPIGSYKWKAIIFKNGTIRVDEYPLCTEHDLRFIHDSDGKYCPYVEKFRRCGNHLDKSKEFRIYQSAKSFIEKEIRNKIN